MGGCIIEGYSGFDTHIFHHANYGIDKLNNQSCFTLFFDEDGAELEDALVVAPFDVEGWPAVGPLSDLLVV